MALTKVRTGGLTDDAVTTDKLYTPNLGRRNLIINGAMQVAQRGTSETGISTSGYYTVDRMRIAAGNTAGRLSMTQESISDLAGFANAIKLDCTTADTSIASDELLTIGTRFEGQDLQQLKKGTSDAEKVTISFYVKGNASATYVLELYEADNTRQVSKSFAVTTSWNRVSLTFDGDTTGSFTDDNNLSLILQIWLHAGSSYTSGTLSTSWSSVTQANRAAGISSFFDSTDRTFFITGLQLEVGSVATPFEHRSFGEELALCQRYYQQSTSIANATSSPMWFYSYNASEAWGGNRFPVEMRASPTCVLYDNTGTAGGVHQIGSPNITGVTVNNSSQQGIFLAYKSSGFTVDKAHIAGWTADSEL